jgi:hypothetical protein
MKPIYKQFDFDEVLELIDSNINVESHQDEPCLDIKQITWDENKKFQAKAAVVYLKLLNAPSGHELNLIRAVILRIMRSNLNCLDIEVGEDSIYGLFNNPTKSDVDDLVDMVGRISSMKYVLSKKLNLNELAIKVGISYGLISLWPCPEAFQTSQYLWSGNALVIAHELANQIEVSNYNVKVSDIIYNNMKESYQSFFVSQDGYCSDVINRPINNWIKEKML